MSRTRLSVDPIRNVTSTLLTNASRQASITFMSTRSEKTRKDSSGFTRNRSCPGLQREEKGEPLNSTPKLGTAASRPRRLKPAPTAERPVVGVGFSRRVRDSAGFSGFATHSNLGGEFYIFLLPDSLDFCPNRGRARFVKRRSHEKDFDDRTHNEYGNS